MFKKAFLGLATVCLLAVGGMEQAQADHWRGGCRHYGGWGGGYGYGRPVVRPYHGGGFYRGPAFYRGGFYGGPRYYGSGVRGGIWIGF